MKIRTKFNIKRFILLFFLCMFSGCSEKNEIMDEEQISINECEGSDIDCKENAVDKENNFQAIADKIITWTLPEQMNPEIIERNVSKVNVQLTEDGYNFTLQVVTFPSGTYREDVVPLLESGEADIVSTGVNKSNGSSGYSQDFIRKGYLEELSKFLKSEEGQFLWNWYYEDAWKRVETDGEFYVFPSQNNVYGSGYIAFNKKYVTEEMLRDFSGTPGELKELLSDIDIPKGVYEVLGTSLDISSLYAMSGVTGEQGVFYNLATGVAESPFLNQYFYQHVKDLNTLYLEGSIQIFEGINAMNSERQAVRDGNFVVWISYKKDAFYEEVKDSVYIVPMQENMVNALSCTSGINSKSAEKEEALQLLTLLYTNETYANLLLFGEEGIDYQLIDGYVCNMEGKEMSNNSRSWTFGTLDTAHPCSNDLIVVDKKAVQDAFFSSEYYLDSAILGFQPDCTGFSVEMKKAMTVLNSYGEIWKEKDLEAAWQKAAEEFEASGGNELVAELNRQVEEWRQNTAN